MWLTVWCWIHLCECTYVNIASVYVCPLLCGLCVTPTYVFFVVSSCFARCFHVCYGCHVLVMCSHSRLCLFTVVRVAVNTSMYFIVSHGCPCVLSYMVVFHVLCYNTFHAYYQDSTRLTLVFHYFSRVCGICVYVFRMMLSRAICVFMLVHTIRCTVIQLRQRTVR